MTIRFSESVTVTLYVLSDEERQTKREATSLCRRTQRAQKRQRQYEEEEEDDVGDVCFESKDNENQGEADYYEEEDEQSTYLASKRKKLKGIYMGRRGQSGHVRASMLPANWYANSKYRCV